MGICFRMRKCREMGIGMTTWEWEGMGILKEIPAYLYTTVRRVGKSRPLTNRSTTWQS